MTLLRVGFAGFAVELRDQGYAVLKHSTVDKYFSKLYYLMEEPCSTVLQSFLSY